MTAGVATGSTHRLPRSCEQKIHGHAHRLRKTLDRLLLRPVRELGARVHEDVRQHLRRDAGPAC